MFSRSRKTSVRQESKRRRSSDPRQGSSCLQLFERSRTTSGRQESKTASIIKVPMYNYFAQRPLSDPRNPFRPDPPVGSSKCPVSVSPKGPRRILEVPFSTYCAQRPPVGSSKSPSLLRPETLPLDPRSPFRPDPPPSDPRSPLLYLINYLSN